MSIQVSKVAAIIVLCPFEMLNAINDDPAMTSATCEVVTVDNEVNVTLTFDIALSPAEDAAVDAIMAAWDNSLCEDIVDPGGIEVERAVVTIAPGATEVVISFEPVLNAGTKYIVSVVDTVTGDVAVSEVLGSYKLLGNVVTHNHYGKIGDNIKYRPILSFASPDVNLDVQNNDTNPIIVSVTRIPMLSA